MEGTAGPDGRGAAGMAAVAVAAMGIMTGA